MNSLLYSTGSIGPVFSIIAIGVLFRRFRLIDSDMSGHFSRLVFHLFLPALLLKAMIGVDLRSFLSLRLVLVVWSTLFASFALAWLLARIAGMDREGQGLFASGAVWGNLAIVGYALGDALYGEEGLARAAILSALLLPLHTPLGFFAMDRRPGGEERRGSVSAMFRRLSRNPVILTIIAGLAMNLIFDAASAQMPRFIMDILGILGRASLPLALVAIGGSLVFTRDPAGWAEPLGAAAVKLLVMPLIAFGLARLAGLGGAWIGSIVIAFSCPTAVSYFVISRSLGHESSRGAAIVTVTTVGAAFTTGVAAWLLTIAGLA